MYKTAANALINKEIKKLMSVPSDTTHASKAKDNWTIAFLLYIWNIFQGKLQFSEPVGLSFQNKIPLILLHKDN